MSEDDDIAIVPDSGLRDRFFRERRLLLGVSLVLLAHLVLGITVERSTETLGLRFTIPNPSTLWKFVWAVWAWTLVSYSQLFNSLQPWLDFPNGRERDMRERWARRFTVWRVRRATRKFAKHEVPADLLQQANAKDHGVDEENTVRGKIPVFQATAYIGWRRSEEDRLEEISNKFRESMESRGWQIGTGNIVRTQWECGFSSSAIFPLDDIRDIRWIRYTSRVWLLASTSMLTDYFAPLLVALAPLVIGLAGATGVFMASFRH